MSRVSGKSIMTLAAGAFAIAAYVLFAPKWNPRRSLTLTGGSPTGLRHQFALVLAAEAKERGLDLTVVPTADSEEALDDVDAWREHDRTPRIDLALTQGGLGVDARTRLRQVATLLCTCW